ncbi:MAG: DUF883 C-terminal domain-containing protein [Thermoanaerobaculum sp.]|nr:DUF883 C-terminal domain-containing protein [Thermoanaerobaculum sp.]MDW7967437.1 DUF883 C-terminal domain-containing protein [Thermoanaerobaculum sp.]
MNDEIRRHDEEGAEVYELEDFDEDEEEPPARPQRLDADFLLDKVIPREIDWRDLVRRHPLLSVSVAAAVGFLIGRSKGAAIVAGASAALTSAVMRQLSGVLDTDVFEF